MEPTQCFEYLGVCWDTNKWMCHLVPKRQEKIKESALELLHSPITTCRHVSRFIGRVQSTDGIFPLAKARTRFIQWDFLSACRDVSQFDELMCLSQGSLEELKVWSSTDLSEGLPITVPSAASSLYTDASDFGIGIYFQGEMISENLPSWCREAHINIKELYAVDRAVELLSEKLTGSVVTVRIDNNTALAAIKKQGSTRNWEISQLAVRILERCYLQQITLVPIRISSAENLLADSASRRKDMADWKLHPAIIRKVFQRLGTPDIDLFATCNSAQVPAYYTWNIGDQYARGVDALAPDLDWSQHSLPYAFPPFSLIPLVLQKVSEQKVPRLILICPFWPSKTFFTALNNLAIVMYRLPFRNSLVTDLQSGLPPPNLKKMRLVVSLISGNPMTSQGEGALISTPKHGLLWSPPGDQELRESMSISGGNGTTTVENVTYNLLPLL